MTTIITNIVATLIILCVVGGASLYIYKEKKKGTKCIGCPNAGNCKKGKMSCDCENEK